jgi:hypothetical protein
MLPIFGVWIWWQHKHNGDMQNASNPFIIVLTLLSLFWSGACALEHFIANYYFLDPNPLRIGKDSQTFNVTVLQARDKLRTINTKPPYSILISQLKL